MALPTRPGQRTSCQNSTSASSSGAATGYLEFGDVQSNLGRSLVCRSLGFRTRNRVVCAVCGAADRPATGPHVCRGAPRWERPPLCREQNHHVAIAGVTADVRRHARCKSQARSPAAAV